jgi:dihydrodipicolinate reductase
MKIFVAGSGKLANALLSGLHFEGCEITKWEGQHQSLNEKSILVHAGSGRQLDECWNYCSKTNSIFIELSTGLETEKKVPDFPLIICPNTSILVLKTLNMLKANGSRFENYNISITESHQATKTTEPGTAYAFADSLNFPHHKIVSVRDPEVQLHKIGIPQEYLPKHAYHKIIIKDGDDEITIETKVLGHKTYVNGVNKIIAAVLKHNWENRKYTILDLIDGNML